MPTVYLAPGAFGAGGQFLTGGVLPLKQGLIYTYIAGGTTPQATYTTSAGNVQNANPIVLGVDGRPPNEIWLTSGTYRFDLTDSLGNLIKTYDDLSGINSSLASLAASTGATLVGWIYAFTGAVAATVQNWISWQSVNVFGFMTISQIADVQAGTLTLDVSTPIKNAINAAASTSPPKGVRYPSGNYKVTVNNALGPNVNTTGLMQYADSPESCKITMVNTTASDLWFYDNGASAADNPSLIAPTFMNIGFVGAASSSGKCQGFRLYGTPGYPSQKFHFINCYGKLIERVLDCEGTSNASENYFSMCRFSQCTTFIYNNNAQAVNNSVVQCDFESYTGNVFDYQNGGSLNVLGGSYVTSSANTTFIVNAVAPVGGMTGVMHLEGIRTELNSATSKICNITGANNGARYYFDDCAFKTASGGTRTSIILGGKGSQQVKFDGCEINTNHTISWIEGTSNYWFSANVFPSLEFDYCSGITVASIAYTDTFSLGYTRIVNSVDGARDWEGSRLGYVDGGSPYSFVPKVANGWLYYWPDLTFNPTGLGSPIGSQVVLPVGATIKNIYVRKASRGGGGTAGYQLQLTDGASVQIVVPGTATGSAVSNIANQSAQHDIMITGLMKSVTDLTTGTIAVAIVGGAGGSAIAATQGVGDWFFVEYF